MVVHREMRRVAEELRQWLSAGEMCLYWEVWVPFCWTGAALLVRVTRGQCSVLRSQQQWLEWALMDKK